MEPATRRFCAAEAVTEEPGVAAWCDGGENGGMNVRQGPRRALIFLARLYQATFSLYLGGQCRFVPTCSNYFIEAVGRYGALRGGAMGIRRLLRCHPFSRGGYDPIP